MPQPEPQTDHDFAPEHENAGFKAAIPLRPGAAEAAGPLEDFDVDERYDRYPLTWTRIKRAVRKAWQRVHPHH